MQPTYDFTGQVAFVTGAGSGMGLATARAYAIGVRCDVTDEDSVAAAVAATVEQFGRSDVAFNNAGTAAGGDHDQ